MSIADVIVAVSLSLMNQTILDAGFRKAMGAYSAWADSVYQNPSVIKVVGQIVMCAKALKPTLAAEPKKEVKKAAPVAAAPKAPVEKKLDNV